MFAYKKKKNILLLLATNDKLGVLLFDSIRSNLSILSPQVFSVSEQVTLNDQGTIDKICLVASIKSADNDKGEYELFISNQVSARTKLPLAIPTKINLVANNDKVDCYGFLYSLYLASLLANWLTRDDLPLLKGFLLEGIKKLTQDRERELLNSIDMSVSILLCEIYRNVGKFFLEEEYFARARMVEATPCYLRALENYKDLIPIEINQIKAYLFEGTLKLDMDLVKVGITLCKKTMLRNDIDPSEKKILRDFLDSAFRTIRSFESN